MQTKIVEPWMVISSHLQTLDNGFPFFLSATTLYGVYGPFEGTRIFNISG